MKVEVIHLLNGDLKVFVSRQSLSRTHAHTHSHTHTCTHVCTHTYMHNHTHTCTHTHIHAHIHAHTHTHTHTHCLAEMETQVVVELETTVINCHSEEKIENRDDC